MVSGDLGEAGGVEFWRAEAERLAADNTALRARVADLEGQFGALAEKVSMLARLAFGTSSEKAVKPVSGGDGVGDASGDGGTSAVVGSGRARVGTAAATTRICPPARRSTTLPRPSGGVRGAARATPRSARSAASRSTGRFS